jgi:hypothetical protein
MSTAPHCTLCKTIEYRCGDVWCMVYGVWCMVYGLEVPVVLVVVSMVLGGFNRVGKSFAVYFEHECKQMYMYARSV